MWGSVSVRRFRSGFGGALEGEVRWGALEGEVRGALGGEVRWRGLGQLKVDKLGDDVVRWGKMRVF